MNKLVKAAVAALILAGGFFLVLSLSDSDQDPPREAVTIDENNGGERPEPTIEPLTTDATKIDVSGIVRTVDGTPIVATVRVSGPAPRPWVLRLLRPH